MVESEVNHTLKYKDNYYIHKEKSDNKEDSYILCKKKVQIYRYSPSLLAVIFWSNKYANLKLKELINAGVQLTILQRGDDEQVYTFNESDFYIVADIVKAKKRIKRNLTEEQKEILRLRLQNVRQVSHRNDT